MVFFLLATPGSIFAQTRVEPHPRFLGAKTCASSGCHGGAGERSNQNLVWSKIDFHSRAFATLTTSRSARMAEALQVKSADQEARCTACHSPYRATPPDRLGPAIDATLGVSCESCHGPAEHWLRSHTRRDYSHEDRTLAGMRDLKDLYVRANSCVACHQRVDLELLQVGHPELIFELDGQTATQPRHWKESSHYHGGKAWLVGQWVAFREMTWHQEKLDSKSKPEWAELTGREQQRWEALGWVLQQTLDAENSNLPFAKRNLRSAPDLKAIHREADTLARQAADGAWSVEKSQELFKKLANTQGAFKDSTLPRSLQARRAERLMLALDRLSLNSAWKTHEAVQTQIRDLFKLVQSLPDFEPTTFAQGLADLHQLLEKK